MERRDFIKITGAGALTLGAAAVGCAPKKTATPSTDEGLNRWFTGRIP